MGRNDPCWCLSGLKWKRCHYNREALPRANFFEVFEEAKRRAQKGYCSHAGETLEDCSQKIVRAHTVQRQGGLREIAEGKSRVLEVKPSWHGMVKHKGNPPPSERGIGDASVFPGFCEFHDAEVFRPIEGRNIQLTASEALLFAYRAIAYERFTKTKQIEDLAVQKDLDRGLPFLSQAEIQQRLHFLTAGARKGLREVDAQLAEYRKRAQQSDIENFHYYAYRFDRVLPLVACGGFMPEIALDGTRLQVISRGEEPPEQLTLVVTSYDAQTVVSFGWVGPKDGACAAYMRCFENVPNNAKADALVQIAFEQLENIYLRISWWKGLSQAQRTDLTNRIRSGVGLNERLPGYYQTDGPLLATGEIVERNSS